jgi:hypothetical protein
MTYVVDCDREPDGDSPVDTGPEYGVVIVVLECR